MTVHLSYDDAMLAHENGPRHPERPARLRSIRNRLQTPEFEALEWHRPEPIERERLERVHDSSYIDRILELRGTSGRLDPDTGISSGSVDAAELAAGAVCDMIDAACAERADRGFALVRPPGHHAEPDQAMGFCLFNNVAVGANYALDTLETVDRVLIVDWDVHHGNGTQTAFWDRDDVLFVSTHQHPFYPGTGALEKTGSGDGKGYNLNIPLAAGMGDADYDAIFEELVVPVSRAFEPDLVLVSAGFDAHARDPLAGMNLSAAGFARLCWWLRELAADEAKDRLALTLEGGYDLDGLADSVEASVEILAGGEPPSVSEDMSPAGREALDAALQHHRNFWPSL